MNPFTILENVRNDYLTYVQTFQRFQNPRIHDWGMGRLAHSVLLREPPCMQILLS